MPNLKEIKRRIISVKNTQKITHAMKLVSAAKFARASQNNLKSRPYGDAFDRLIAKIVQSGSVESPLLEVREEKKSLIVVVATDRGLCGGLNNNLFRQVVRFVEGKPGKVTVAPWGRRAVAFFKSLDLAKTMENTKVLESPNYEFASEIGRDLCAKFEAGEYDKIYLAFAKFSTALSQEPKILTLLPASPETSEVASSEASGDDFLFEPSQEELLDRLLRDQVANRIFRALLEGAASEHGARMTAMDSATNNAKEVTKKLTLEYNRARQAAITKELIEITSGAEAL